MSQDSFLSEAVDLSLAPESALATLPSAEWVKLQIDTGGVTAWRAAYTEVERNIHSKFMTPEAGDHVAKDIAPSLTHDTNKDFLDVILPSAFRCLPVHFGGTGVSKFRPSAVTATGFTVAANGAVPDGVLFYPRGFTAVANGGVKKASGAIATEIKCAGLTVEAAPPANATLDLIGFEGALADLSLDASGHLISAGAIDFTTILDPDAVGSPIYLPTVAEATAMGNAAYALPVSGRAYIKSIAAGKVELEHREFATATASGAGKTARVFFASRFYRNWALDNANYARPTLYGEKADYNEDGSSVYTDAKGLAVKTLTIAAPIDSKITSTVAFVGMDVNDPSATRSGPNGGLGLVAGDGPAKAYAPTAEHLVDGQNDLQSVRMLDSGGDMIAEVNSFTFTLENNIAPKKVLGTFGAAGHKYGKFNYSVDAELYFDDADMFAAATDNRAVTFDVLVKNDQFAWAIRLPNVRLRNPDETYAANEPVMLKFQLPAFRDSSNNIAGSMGVFGWLPSA